MESNSENILFIESSEQVINRKTLEPQRLKAAKRSFVTRRVNLNEARYLIDGNYRPRAGDLVLARVARVGQHKRIERPDGRRSHLFAGDEIILCLGDRYAPDQFECEVPKNLDECDMVAAGGIAGNMVVKHRAISNPTRIQPIGVLADKKGQVLNVNRWVVSTVDHLSYQPEVICVIGTSMNAGKTTSAARLIKGLTRAGQTVAAAKITGTGAGGDFWMMSDAGASEVVDFTDMGYASTYKLKSQDIESILEGLLAHLSQSRPDTIVIEVADGLLQPETRDLVTGDLFAQYVDRVVFAAQDAMGAITGSEMLRNMGHQVAAISGAFTASPLSIREVEAVGCHPVLLKTDLSNPEMALSLTSHLCPAKIVNN